MITLKNLSKRTVIFNLPHAFACSETVCTCSRMKVGVTDHDKASGDRKVRAVNQRLAHSVTLLPRGSKADPKPVAKGEKASTPAPLDQVSGLLDGVARVPEIVEAAARGEIEITRQPNAVAPEAAPAEPAAAEPLPATSSDATAADSPRVSNRAVRGSKE